MVLSPLWSWLLILLAGGLAVMAARRLVRWLVPDVYCPNDRGHMTQWEGKLRCPRCGFRA